MHEFMNALNHQYFRYLKHWSCRFLDY